MIQAGEADMVLELGRRLFQRGERQVEQSDEGLMGAEIDASLGVVFAALKRSSLDPVEQMLWAWDLAGKDDYCICLDTNRRYWQGRFKKSQWSNFADVLLGRLQAFDAEHQRQGKKKAASAEVERRHAFEREWRVRKLREALEKAGRQEEIEGLFEFEPS